MKAKVVFSMGLAAVASSAAMAEPVAIGPEQLKSSIDRTAREIGLRRDAEQACRKGGRTVCSSKFGRVEVIVEGASERPKVNAVMLMRDLAGIGSRAVDADRVWRVASSAILSFDPRVGDSQIQLLLKRVTAPGTQDTHLDSEDVHYGIANDINSGVVTLLMMWRADVHS